MFSRYLILNVSAGLLAAGLLNGQELPVPGKAEPPPIADVLKLLEPGPRILFATTNYDFGRVKAGEIVKYTFLFSNTGDAPLELKEVRPSCGCTTAGDWNKNVGPGGSGAIPVQFDSSKFNGPLHKLITVTSNDKDQPSVVLQLGGTVWKPIEIVPPNPVLTVAADATNVWANVRVISSMEQPLTISELSSSNPGFDVTILRTNQPGKEYLLTIRARPGLSTGSIKAKVSLKTSSSEFPLIEIPFMANVLPAITVSPPAIVLSQPRLAGKTNLSVAVYNNTSMALSLSEAAVNVPGVEFRINETHPHRAFHLQFSFPEGFEIPSGQQVMFTAQSGIPLFPQITVPIVPGSLPSAAGVPTAPLPAQESVLDQLPGAAKRAAKFNR